MSHSSPHYDVLMDERLRAALRHAPDAAVGPPSAVSAAIRRVAHAAIEPRPTAVQRGLVALQQFWQALAAPRPVWAGGFAAVLISVVTVNLWIGEPLPPAVVPSTVLPGLAPVPNTQPGAATSTSAAATGADIASASPGREMQSTVAIEPSPLSSARTTAEFRPGVTAGTGRKEAPAAAPAAVDARRDPSLGDPTPPASPAAVIAEKAAPAPGLPPAPGPAPAAVPSPAVLEQAAMPLARSTGEATVPATQAATSPGLTNPQVGPSRRTDPVDSPPPAAPTEVPRARGDVPLTLRSIPRRSAASSASSDVPQVGQVAAGVQPPMLAAWLRAARRDTDDPAWPLPATHRRALLALQAASGSHWQLESGPVPAAGYASREYVFGGDSSAAATFRVESGGARWIEADGRQWFVPLDAVTLQILAAGQ